MSAPAAASADSKSQAVRMLVLATACWALSFPVVKALAFEQAKLLPGAGSWFFTSLGVMYRFGTAGLAMVFVVSREAGKLSRLEFEQGVWLALFGGGGILFQMDGLTYTDASTSAFLTQAYCVFLPVWTALTRRHLPSLKIFLCVAIVLAGVAVLAGVDIHSFKLGRGESETLVASMLFAGQILLLEHPRYASNRPAQFSTVMFLAMAFVSLPLVVVTSPDAMSCFRAYASVPACVFLFLLVAVSTLGGYLLMNRWQRQVTATEAGLIYCIEPVLASALALFLPGWFSAWTGMRYANEQLTLRLLLGGGLVTAANVLLQSRWLETAIHAESVRKPERTLSGK